jgi:hypothetical protein
MAPLKHYCGLAVFRIDCDSFNRLDLKVAHYPHPDTMTNASDTCTFVIVRVPAAVPLLSSLRFSVSVRHVAQNHFYYCVHFRSCKPFNLWVWLPVEVRLDSLINGVR